MGRIAINRNYCKGCALCTTACTRGLLAIGTIFNASGYYSAEYRGDEDACTGCALCAEICPDAAIEVWK